eukprot:852492_1
MASITEECLVKRLQTSTECEYLHDIYNTEISTIIYNEYGLNCPPLVSQLICTLAHNNDELRSIFQNKLFYKHFIDLYGNKSWINTKLNIFHTIYTSSIYMDISLTAFKYLLNINNF